MMLDNRYNHRDEKRLCHVLGDGKPVEQYVYDPAGNILTKTVNGKTTTFTYDKANQLVNSTVDGKTTDYRYDGAGRLVQEGDKTYQYGYLDKILNVLENGEAIAGFDYHIGGQIASSTTKNGTENFLWDGLALIHRGGTNYINEPYITGGNPILADGNVLFNDMLGTTLGIKSGESFDSITRDAFGQTADQSKDQFFTGKPYVGELGYAFLFRNYRAEQGKWQTQDPLGYPNGPNNFAYVNNRTTFAVDPLGLETDWVRDGGEQNVMGRVGWSWSWGVDLEPGGWMLKPVEDYVPNMHLTAVVHDAWLDYLQNEMGLDDWYTNIPTMIPSFSYALCLNLYETGAVGVSYIIEGGEATYNYVLQPIGSGVSAGFNWLTDPLSNLFSSFGNNIISLFNSAHSNVSPNGRPE